jgi:hypothetical protein
MYTNIHKSILVGFIFLISLFLSGCASKIMESYIGRDVRTAVLDYGPPQNAIDMGDGTRAFQWIMRKSYKQPTYISSTGNAYTYGTGYGYSSGYGSNRYYRGNYNTTTWMNSNTVITGGNVIHSKCIYTIFAKWNEKRKGWIVTGYKKPPLACE